MQFDIKRAVKFTLKRGRLKGRSTNRVDQNNAHTKIEN